MSVPPDAPAPPRGALLFPGAGGDRTSPALVAIEEALEAVLGPGATERVDFPYRRAGRKAPDRMPVLVRTIVEAAEDLAGRLGVTPGQLVLGGRSMGGRACSMAVAEGLPAAGLVLVAYPLHPPGRPEKARTAHLADLDLPVLAVSGTRDPFGSPDELRAAFGVVPGPVRWHLVEGGRHELKGTEAEVAGVVAAWVRDLGGQGA